MCDEFRVNNSPSGDEEDVSGGGRLADDMFTDGLPTDLASVEERLLRLAPTSSRLDRDELMFRAGAAAAEVRLVQGGGGLRRQQWTLPLWTAAAAAVFAVAMTRQFWPSLPAGDAAGGQTGPDAPAGAVAEGALVKATGEDRPVQLPTLRFASTRAPMLAAREKALRFEFDSPPAATAAEGPVSSVRQLREELLPPRATPQWQELGLWNWLQGLTVAGETT